MCCSPAIIVRAGETKDEHPIYAQMIECERVLEIRPTGYKVSSSMINALRIGK